MLYLEMMFSSALKADVAQRNANGISIGFRLEINCGLDYVKLCILHVNRVCNL